MSDTCPPGRVDEVRRRFHEFARATITRPATLTWTLGLFERGLKIADELEAIIGPLAGKRVLDIGSAHGGDLAALYARGARCVGSDKFAFDHAGLRQHLQARDGRLQFVRLDGTRSWPIADRSCDVVMSMSVVEFVHDLDGFFAELARVLKPGGVGLVETAITFKMLRRDPIYGLPLVGLLPNRLRRWVAESVFRRGTDYRLSRHKFHSAGKFRRHVAPLGLRVVPVKFAGSPVMARVSRWPIAPLWRALIRHFAFDFVLVVSPELEQQIRRHQAETDRSHQTSWQVVPVP